MARSNDKKRCGSVRDWLAAAVGMPGVVGAAWLERHLATCPQCRKRLAGLAKVSVALSLVKSQPCSLSLLNRANGRALAMVARSVRQTTQAEALRYVLPKPTLADKLKRTVAPMASAAACMLALALVRMDATSDMVKLGEDTAKAMRSGYVNHIDEQLNDMLS